MFIKKTLIVIQKLEALDQQACLSKAYLNPLCGICYCKNIFTQVITVSRGSLLLYTVYVFKALRVARDE